MFPDNNPTITKGLHFNFNSSNIEQQQLYSIHGFKKHYIIYDYYRIT